MQIKGASERIMEATRTMEGANSKDQTNKSEIPSQTPINLTLPQAAVKMLATPRHSFSITQDNDVDYLLAECKASADAAAETKVLSSTSSNVEANQSETSEPVKSIEYGKYTVDDIDEWLVLTSFYDEAYRQETLARHRRVKSRLQAIEQEKQQLLREEQEQLQRHRVTFASSSFAPAVAEPTPGPDVAMKQDKSSYCPPAAQFTPSRASNHASKRAHNDMKDERSDKSERPNKVARRQSLERFQIESIKHTPPRAPAQWSREHTPKEDGKGISHHFTRPDLFDNYSAPRKVQHAPDTRYFHIRSWNHENVWAAQQDCIWVTQKSNESTFVEAFEQSRRVILFFSVNNSKAFQGIAEMGSVPGQSQDFFPGS